MDANTLADVKSSQRKTGCEEIYLGTNEMVCTRKRLFIYQGYVNNSSLVAHADGATMAGEDRHHHIINFSAQFSMSINFHFQGQDIPENFKEDVHLMDSSRFKLTMGSGKTLEKADGALTKYRRLYRLSR
ncbi:hypothetical protein MRS44_008808 [Fusarium solani]|uniref:uncharacterized protein n=1 Tax=Fusarium solani TaxID=169388 RepID=UPI0032C46B50|nr:hypothetical protein MRS44_008808 [Fusarium solani]